MNDILKVFRKPLYPISWIIYFIAKAYRDIADFQFRNTWLPLWESDRTYIPLDTWHFMDGTMTLMLIIPYLWYTYRDKFWKVLISIALTWIALYQIFIWCYHYFFRIEKDLEHILNSYLFWNWF